MNRSDASYYNDLYMQQAQASRIQWMNFGGLVGGTNTTTSNVLAVSNDAGCVAQPAKPLPNLAWLDRRVDEVRVKL